VITKAPTAYVDGEQDAPAPRVRDRERERERDKDREREREREREPPTRKETLPTPQAPTLPSMNDQSRPQLPPAKSAPATAQPATRPAPGPAGSTTGPPPIKPLQTAKKLPPPTDRVEKERELKGPAAAAAALEKPLPKQTERRISSLSEPQIMEKLRGVVLSADPRTLYDTKTMKKVGQGYVFVNFVLVSGSSCLTLSYLARLAKSLSPPSRSVPALEKLEKVSRA
jgi:hypothetical protein